MTAEETFTIMETMEDNTTKLQEIDKPSALEEFDAKFTTYQDVVEKYKKVQMHMEYILTYLGYDKDQKEIGDFWERMGKLQKEYREALKFFQDLVKQKQ